MLLLQAVLPLVMLVQAVDPAARAAATAEEKRLGACIDKIATDPTGAYEDGLAWLNEGGRPAAQHCTALALIELKQPSQAAARLETLANAKNGGSIEQRLIYLSQAANAWMLAGNPEAAAVAATSAIKLAPRDAEVRKDRARAELLLKQWDKAGKDLDLANELSPGNADTLRLRAEVLLQNKRLDEAESDIERALKIAPKDVDVLVMRGRIREAKRVAAENN